MQLILVRHGETIWNKEGRVQGISDIELSAVGRKQAQSLAINLKDCAISAIHSSPLKRAYHTADIINKYLNLNIETHRELMELDQGDFEGFTFPELMARERDFLRTWKTDPASVKMPNGESLIELQQRAWRAMEKIIDRSENALIVSHNFTIAVLLCRLQNISLTEFRRTCVDTASKTVVRFAAGEIVIESQNDLTHLKDEFN